MTRTSTMIGLDYIANLPDPFEHAPTVYEPKQSAPLVCAHGQKDCQPSPPVRQRRTGTRNPTNKVGKLEKKLDGLVALLQATASSSAVNGNNSPSTIGPSAAGNFRDEHYHSDQTIRTGDGLLGPALTPAATPASNLASSIASSLVHPALEPSPGEAETYLNSFRTDFVRYFPFVIIAPLVSAQQLRQTSPFLWLCIMTVASTSSSQQILLSREVRELFGREAYLQGTRNMDLLLACLVYATWDRRYHLDKPILTSLAQFAIAILYDLGLDKPNASDSGLLLEYDLKGLPRPSQTMSPTPQERRALLGCFYLSSVPSFARKGQSLAWTAYCTECLVVIEQQKEYASDELLTRLVRSRLIAERVVDIPWPSMVDDGHLTRPSAKLYLKSLQAQLRTLKSSTFNEGADQKLSIHEVGFSQAQDEFTGPFNLRFECLSGCLQAIKSWIDVFLTIPPIEYVGFSASIYAMMARCLIDLWRLSTCEYAEWDHSLVRESLDVSSVIEQTQRNFSMVKDSAGLDLGGTQDCDFFGIMAIKLSSMKASWDAMSASTELATPLPDELGEFPMEFLDAWNW
ncbi:MAG: hypothetical protein Q9171_005997 [Xanthocarpia ochracea]